jgi:hypothetical protein
VLRALQVFFGVVASLLALLMLVIAGWAASFTHHNVNGYEREHLDAAVQFVREQERIKGAIPDSEQFTEWARSMDSKGHFRFDGYGYALDKRCSPNPAEFCIGFWTGDDWVTYRSWQSSMEKVSLNDTPLLLVTGLLAAALVAGAAARWLLARKGP